MSAGAWAAVFPREPWNCVCLDPQPTLTGASSKRDIVRTDCRIRSIPAYLRQNRLHVGDSQTGRRKLRSLESTSLHLSVC